MNDELAQPEFEADRRSDPISKLRNLRDIQGRKGNYDVDDYMRGLYNGLELSLSIFEGRSPDYKEPMPMTLPPCTSCGANFQELPPY